MNKQIIAIGGGGFGRNSKHNKIEKYILSQINLSNPNILFIPTASAENDNYIVNFYDCFSKLNCKPNHLTLFKRTPRLDGLINKADIIIICVPTPLGIHNEPDLSYIKNTLKSINNHLKENQLLILEQVLLRNTKLIMILYFIFLKMLEHLIVDSIYLKIIHPLT